MAGWSFNGFNLMDAAYKVEVVGSFYNLPPVRGDNVVIPNRDGRLAVPKFFDQRVVTLGMWVRGATRQDFETKVDLLKHNLGVKGLKLLRRTMANGANRDAQAEQIGILNITMLGEPGVPEFAARFTADFRLPDPFFYADNLSTLQLAPITQTSTSFEWTDQGTADIQKAVIDFAGPLNNPKLINNTLNVWVQYSGAVAGGDIVRIDCGAWTATLNSDTAPVSVIGSLTHAGDSRFMRARPGINTMTFESSTLGGYVKLTWYTPYL